MKETSKLKNLKGNRYGRLLVLDDIYSNKYKHRVWRCQCDCGNIKEYPSSTLIKNRANSCGCIYNESRKDCNKTHGETNSPLYRRWASMKARCSPTSHHSKYYHNRGISYISNWELYENFKLDMEKSFIIHSKKFGTRNTTLERINTNKGYNKSNCKWATTKEQSCNKRVGLNINSLKRLNLFLSELSNQKGISEIKLSKEEYLTYSYNCRMKL